MPKYIAESDGYLGKQGYILKGSVFSYDGPKGSWMTEIPEENSDEIQKNETDESNKSDETDESNKSDETDETDESGKQSNDFSDIVDEKV